MQTDQPQESVYVSLRDIQKAMVAAGYAIDKPEKKQVEFIPGTYELNVTGQTISKKPATTTIKVQAISKKKISW